jgi:G3E family GTPase
MPGCSEQPGGYEQVMREQLNRLIPPAMLTTPDIAAARLLTSVLMRVNFIPGVRQRLGWRGIKESPNDGISIKIAGQTGVYGLSYVACEQVETYGIATFDLSYFPDPESDLLEHYSVAACIAALQDDYLDQVREFTRYNAFKALFHIARIEVVCRSGGIAVELRLEAADRLVLISADGVSITKDNQQLQAVAPGEIDQDLPAYDLAAAFFEIVATSLSFCLSNSPSRLKCMHREGFKYIYYQNHKISQKPDPAISQRLFSLSWGTSVQHPGQDNTSWTTDLTWEESEERPGEYATAAWWQGAVPGANYSVDKNSMGISELPKLIVLTGFLGSGKTSFLNHFIEYQAERNAFVAIVQNEIGATGLDAHLLGQNYAVTEIDEGCICCTLAGNLKLALAEIASDYQPDFVVVETTGLANPANFVHEISELENQINFCSITTVVDATRGLAAIDKYSVAQEQLILADVILLNKANSVSTAELTSLMDKIQRMNPLATVHKGDYGDFSAPELYGVNLTGNIDVEECLKRAEKTGHATHSRHNISSVLVKLEYLPDRETFLSQTMVLSDKVLRIKGVVQFHNHAERYYYQYVPGSNSLTPVNDEAPDENFLVFIGEDIENSAQSLLTLISSQQKITTQTKEV